MREKNIVAGLGEVGLPILKLLKNELTIGFDINSKLNEEKKLKNYEHFQTIFLHVCIPYNNNFIKNVLLLNKTFLPKIIIIHSTISPKTTKKIQSKISVPVIYSATRGIHMRMLKDLKKYTKFFGIEKNAPKSKWAVSKFENLMKKYKIKTKRMRDPVTLEIAKIVVDTSYYGWLINFAQISNIITKKYGIDYDEMWSFANEIHQYLGNRPKMFPGYIGGHCVIPNLSLINEGDLYQIDKINNMYAKKVKEAKLISKKYGKGKQSYNSKQ